jgi:hypothetical protein
VLALGTGWAACSQAKIQQLIELKLKRLSIGVCCHLVKPESAAAAGQ